MKAWMRKGEHWIWISSAMVSISVVLVVGLIAMITYKGAVHFWPHPVYELQVNQNGQSTKVIAELRDSKSREVMNAETGVEEELTQYLIKVGNRDVYGIDFRWVNEGLITSTLDKLSEDVLVIERYEYGNVFGHLVEMSLDGKKVTDKAQMFEQLENQVTESTETYEKIRYIEKHLIGAIDRKSVV